MSVTITASLLGTVLSFLVVATATHLTTSILSDESSVVYSLLTAAITSVVWFGVTYLVSGAVGVGGYVVALGPALAVVAYVFTVDVLYEKGIVQAAAISLGTWTISFAILYAAAYFGYSSFQALGVPPGI